MHKVEHGSFFRLPSLDKVVHGGIFVIFAILWLRVGSVQADDLELIVGGFALAIVSELGQLMPFVRRDANLFDMLTRLRRRVDRHRRRAACSSPGWRAWSAARSRARCTAARSARRPP